MISILVIIGLAASNIACWVMYVLSREKKEALELQLRETQSDVEIHREAYIQTLAAVWNHLDMIVEMYPEVTEEQETVELMDVSAYEDTEDDEI